MDAFLGAIGIVGVIAGIILIIAGKIKKKKYKGGLVTLVSFIIFVIAVAMTPSNKTTSSKPIENKQTVEEPKSITWEQKIKEVAATNKTPTEKFDEISAYAKDYKPTKEEISQFGKYIIQEYKSRKYITDISNHEYMLQNIFKSQVIDKSIKTQDDPMKSFVFDFYQNVKYNYRGVETMVSESTLSNEKQMDKALKEIEQ